jgi:hypothetical protein
LELSPCRARPPPWFSSTTVTNPNPSHLSFTEIFSRVFRLRDQLHLRDRLRLCKVTFPPWIRVYRRFSGELLIQLSIDHRLYSRVSVAVFG